jgi:hypothetical protein
VIDESAVDLALLEMAANGTALDVGQAALVRQMCTSGARLQLAIAPAGAGKTTAMRALTLAWTEDGGQVIGLATSAAAAAVLAEQTSIRTDTLAKLTWSLDHGNLPDWAAAVGPSTLVIIDEAAWPALSPSTPPCSSPSIVVRVSDWSVMINNSPRSVPVVCFATSNRPMAPCA